MVLATLAKEYDKQTGQSIAPVNKDQYAEEKAACEAKGGKWDPISNTCILPIKETATEAARERDMQTGSSNVDPKALGQYSEEKGGFVGADGSFYPTQNKDFRPQTTDQTVEFKGDKVIYQGKELTKEEYAAFQGKGGAITSNVEDAQLLTPQVQRYLQAQQLAGQTGEFGQLGISPTGLDFKGSVQAGLVDAIPKAIAYAATGAAVGGTAGAGLGGIGAAPGAIIGAVGGFASGLASSMISELKGQRRDTTNAQQRVLDEGKQTMKDWATLAEVDPANKARYLAEYNKVAAQIDQAYRQMKLDTSRDLGKFERGIPNLAEFEAFYAAGGERDTLDIEMRNALLGQASIDYRTLELAKRRGKLND